MTRIFKFLFIFSFLFYWFSTAYIRVKDIGTFTAASDLFYSLPMDAFPLKYLEGKRSISIQIGVLSKEEVTDLLKTNPNQFPGCHEVKNIFHPSLSPMNIPEDKRDYVVLRFKNKYLANWGDIKCYFSCFPYPVVEFISLPSRMTNYYNIIFPYPKSLGKNKDTEKTCKISLRWKSFWGRP